MTAHAIECLNSRTDQQLTPTPNRGFVPLNFPIVTVQAGDGMTENLMDIKLWVAGSQRTIHTFPHFIGLSLDSRTDFGDKSRLVSPSEDETIAPQSSAAASLAERASAILEELTTLDRGWDGYDGIPVHLHTVQRAQEFLEAIEKHTQRMPDIVPLSNGGLQLEWFVGNYEVEVEIDASSSGAIQVSFECPADDRCVDEILVNDPNDVSGIAKYFEEFSC